MCDDRNNLNTDSENNINKLKYAMLVEYDGSEFGGSQVQPNARTVQEEIEKALLILFKREVKIVFSGRTDAGVSAIGQVCHFEAYNLLNIKKFLHSLNGLLPKDIAVRDAQQVASNFHARKTALNRWYRYHIYNHPFRSAINKNTLHINYKLDENSINEALKRIIGTHEFDSFKSSKTDNPTSNCTIYEARCFRDGDNIYIDIIANRFVYNMVRIIVGTLLEVGTNQKTVNYLTEIINLKDRTKAGITVKPHPLYLMAVGYPEEFKLFQSDTNPKISEIIPGNFMETQNEDILCKTT